METQMSEEMQQLPQTPQTPQTPQIQPPEVAPSRNVIQAQPNDARMFRPMLSAKLPCAEKRVPTQEEVIADLKRLDWSRGFLASPKIDGIRCVKSPDGLVSRTLTPIPNKFMQECLSPDIFNGLDGELILGTMEAMVNFNDTQSAVMSREGSPYFEWCVFDDVGQPNNAFWWRTERAMERVSTILEFGNLQDLFGLRYIKHRKVEDVNKLLEYESEQIALGYEGIMFRDPGGRYKSFPSNRSTFKQQGLIKLKRFVDAEAIITGFVELQRNTNEQKPDKLGYAKRSSALAGQVGAETLGKFLVRGINGRFKDCEFAVGSGLDDSLRNTIWGNRESYLGRILKYKYQDAGAKDNPRSPIFLGFRDRSDL